MSIIDFYHYLAGFLVGAASALAIAGPLITARQRDIARYNSSQEMAKRRIVWCPVAHDGTVLSGMCGTSLDAVIESIRDCRTNEPFTVSRFYLNRIDN